jgi:alpha-L-arabinofuranosidase
MMRRSPYFLFVAWVLTAGPVPRLVGQQPADITVRTNEVLGPVNRLVFGQNIDAADNARIFSSDTTDLNLIQRGDGYWDPVKGIPVPAVLEQSKDAGTSLLRYPGGCLAHNFDWRKAVGPDAKASGWLFGLDQYLALCAAIGAAPLITVSDYALPADQMPENAADLVEYLNAPANPAHPWAMKRKLWGHPAPYGVLWFELGNESMHGNHRVIPHREFTAEQYAAYANATAAAMRAVDPRIRIGIVTVPGPGTDAGSDWNRTVVRLAGAGADFIVLHLYAPQLPRNGTAEGVALQAMMVTPQHIEERLAAYHRMIREQLGHDLPLAITEFNGALDQPGLRFSYANALECADLIRVFLQPESNVAMANYFNFLNGAFGMLRTTIGSANGEPLTEEPALPLFKLWSQHFGSELVKVGVESPRAEFPGIGSEEASRGAAAEAEREIERIDLDKYSTVTGALWPRLLNVQIQRQSSDLTVQLQNLNRSIYPVLARIPRPAIESGTPVEFRVSFDAEFTPAAGSGTALMGIGLMDSRGWNQTHSGIGVDGITAEWKHFQGVYRLDPQTPNVDVTVRLVGDGKNVTGTLRVHHLEVADFVSAHDVAYPLLTASASVSADGRKVYLVVLNKGATDAIPATIHLAAFAATGARYWEVNGPGLDSTSGVNEAVSGAAIPLSNATTATHVFPAHSMTAIEFSKSQ